jgi:bifunctional non-homologous end joining protein LigD
MAAASEGADSYVDVGGHRLRLTNLDTVLYPETGTTKAEVIDYYSRVADALISHARDRPATRKRWVSGVGTAEKPGQVFFEKNLPDSAPDWITHRSIQHSDHVNEYPLVNNLATLVWIAQQAALEIHVPQWRFGRNGARKNPDRMVLDLDPGEGAGLAECAEVAKLVRELLKGMGLDPMPVTSGSKGIHLYAALDGTQSSDEVSAVAHELARALEADHPDLVVSDMKKAVRGGKVLLDWSQNNGSKTTVVPYSLRGRLRPTVAAPRTWREISAPGLKQLEFTEVLKRLAAKGDPLADLSAGHLLKDPSGEDLAEYRRMRNRNKTPEPFGDVPGSDPSWTPDPANPHFVIQEHHASALHYDFRLERDGVLVSWAVPKGVPTDPKQNHLAVHVEDHPFDYGSFEGPIPKGEYGAGQVAIWDRGRYELEKWRDTPGDGEIILTIHGEKHGSHRLALIQTKQGDNPKNWMLHLMKSQNPVDWDAEGGPVDTVTGGKWHGHASVSTGRKGLGTPKKTIVGSRLPSDSIHPMLATLGAVTGPDRFRGGDDWAYEMKWDGIRAIATIRGDELNLRSRNGLDLTPSYPELAELVKAVKGDAVLDGEIVALDAKGRPRFGTLQQRMGLTSPRDVERARLHTPVHFFVFDVLELGGETQQRLPYEKRRALLLKTVKSRGPAGDPIITVPPDAGTDLENALKTSKKLGLEGVMAKRLDSPYRAGKRSRDWIKLKHTLTQEVVVGGWRPGTGHRSGTIGSLLVGIPDADGLRYVGRVGTGFTDRQLAELRTRLDALARQTSPLIDVPSADTRDAHWVTPTLVGEVEFAELTSDGRLRAPAWRGWRPDKNPDQVVLETP